MKHTLRPAIAMIELIFSLVIMAIVLLSAPNLISSATKSGYVTFQQEAIATTSAEIGMILTHYWDEGDTNETVTAPILITLGDNALNEATISALRTGRMAGTPSSSSRTFTLSAGAPTTRINTTTSANLGADSGDDDDIDDFSSNTARGLTDYEATSTATSDTVDQSISLLTTVTYVSDATTYNASTVSLNQPFLTASANDTSNIKFVQVRLSTTNTASELAKNITLKAFTCNIGTFELNEGSL